MSIKYLAKPMREMAGPQPPFYQPQVSVIFLIERDHERLPETLAEEGCHSSTNQDELQPARVPERCKIEPVITEQKSISRNG